MNIEVTISKKRPVPNYKYAVDSIEFVATDSLPTDTSIEMACKCLKALRRELTKALDDELDVMLQESSEEVSAADEREQLNYDNINWGGETAGTEPVTNSVPQQCKDCGMDITPRVLDFSMNRFGRPLCYDCQRKGDNIATQDEPALTQ